MKKFLTAVIACFLLGTLVAGCGGKGGDSKKEAAGDTKFMQIATGGTAGTYYPLGGAIADILNKNMTGVKATAEASGASVANVNLLKQGNVKIAFLQNDIAYYAVNGTEMFKDKKFDGLRGIATLYPETIQIVTLEKTGIKSLADVKGKRVAVGAPGSGTEANARQILTAYGISYEDVKVQYLSFAEAAGALKDGNVDVAFVTAGHPTAAIRDIATQHKVVLLGVEGKQADDLIAKYPFYTKLTIPANTYANQAADVPAVAVRCMLAVNDKMDDATAGAIVKAIYGNLPRLQQAHSAAKAVTKETALDGMSIKMNPGAEKFFKGN